ncbi:MAG: hypothetical protein AAB922_01400 [Patescibacteria group bacterium]
MNKNIIKALFPEQYERIERGECPMCSKKMDLESEFTEDDLGMREFLISGACAGCQNKVFNGDE